MVKVRFAPSPTGTLHVGGIRTALFNYFFAKSQKGKFILRNEDTDQARKVEGSLEATQESLQWLGISFEEVISQSERLAYYKKYAAELLSKGRAIKEGGALRFITKKEGTTSWKDEIGNKEISFKNKDIEDFIILKKDGFPTYHLANVVDDHLMGITHVIRGEDWIPSTPKHLMLYNAFSWTSPTFVHVPNVLGTDGKKLSKRRGAKSVIDFKNEGILSDALLNYLMLLGWSPKDDREILSIEEITKEFSIKKVNAAPAVFDERKLLWMNGEYIRKIDESTLESKLLEFDPTLSSIKHLKQYIPLAQTRIKTLADFKPLVEDSPEVSLSEEQKQLVSALITKYAALSNWTTEVLLKATFEARDETKTSTKDLYVVLTGKAQGLPLAEKLEIQGKDYTLSFLENHLVQ